MAGFRSAPLRWRITTTSPHAGNDRERAGRCPRGRTTLRQGENTQQEETDDEGESENDIAGQAAGDGSAVAGQDTTQGSNSVTVTDGATLTLETVQQPDGDSRGRHEADS